MTSRLVRKRDMNKEASFFMGNSKPSRKATEKGSNSHVSPRRTGKMLRAATEFVKLLAACAAPQERGALPHTRRRHSQLAGAARTRGYQHDQELHSPERCEHADAEAEV